MTTPRKGPIQTDHRLVERWDERDYERHSSHQREWGGSLIEELALRGDERVWDLGDPIARDPALTSRTGC